VTATRRLAAILAADVAGYARLMAAFVSPLKKNSSLNLTGSSIHMIRMFNDPWEYFLIHCSGLRHHLDLCFGEFLLSGIFCILALLDVPQLLGILILKPAWPQGDTSSQCREIIGCHTISAFSDNR
jgi:hypothetical protein